MMTHRENDSLVLSGCLTVVSILASQVFSIPFYRMKRTTRKAHRGGFTRQNRSRLQYTLSRMTTATKKPEQIVHCLSQLKRFTQCFKTGDTSRMLQFGYNLGRLQELLGETDKHKIWWKPIDALIAKKKWTLLDAQVEKMRRALDIDYDQKTLDMGC